MTEKGLNEIKWGFLLGAVEILTWEITLLLVQGKRNPCIRPTYYHTMNIIFDRHTKRMQVLACKLA